MTYFETSGGKRKKKKAECGAEILNLKAACLSQALYIIQHTSHVSPVAIN